MRLPFLLALALAACDSDPCGGGASCVTFPPDAGADAGFDAGGPVDVSDDRPAPIDNGPADAGVDASFHSDPIPLADLGVDLGAGDAGSDAGVDVVCNADAGLFACGGECRNLIRDSMNCGRCGEACVGAATCMSAQCIDPQTDPRNCGGLRQQCRAPNGTAGCVAGVCTVGSCNTIFANCDGNVANGCEVDTWNTDAHCGGCNRPCSAGQSCREGVCR